MYNVCLYCHFTISKWSVTASAHDMILYGWEETRTATQWRGGWEEGIKRGERKTGSAKRLPFFILPIFPCAHLSHASPLCCIAVLVSSRPYAIIRDDWRWVSIFYISHLWEAVGKLLKKHVSVWHTLHFSQMNNFDTYNVIISSEPVWETPNPDFANYQFSDFTFFLFFFFWKSVNGFLIQESHLSERLCKLIQIWISWVVFCLGNPDIGFLKRNICAKFAFFLTTGCNFVQDCGLT